MTLLGALALGLLSALAACQSKELGAAGADCYEAAECEPGLVCVPLQDGRRVCSSDLAQVAGSPPDRQTSDGGDGGAQPGDGGPNPPADSGQDSAPPVDAGADVSTD